MKKIAKIILFNLAAVASAYSQDMISLRNGEEIKANIKEVSDREVVFTYDKETSFLIELNIDQAGEYAVTLDGSNFNLFGID